MNGKKIKQKILQAIKLFWENFLIIFNISEKKNLMRELSIRRMKIFYFKYMTNSLSYIPRLHP